MGVLSSVYSVNIIFDPPCLQAGVPACQRSCGNVPRWALAKGATRAIHTDSNRAAVRFKKYG
jgi:hypothetical protein